MSELVSYQEDQYSAEVMYYRVNVDMNVRLTLCSTGRMNMQFNIIKDDITKGVREYLDIKMNDKLSMMLAFNGMDEGFNSVIEDTVSVLKKLSTEYGFEMDYKTMVEIGKKFNVITQIRFGNPMENRDIYGGDIVLVINNNYHHPYMHYDNIYPRYISQEDLKKMEEEKMEAIRLANLDEEIEGMFNYKGLDCMTKKYKKRRR